MIPIETVYGKRDRRTDRNQEIDPIPEHKQSSGLDGKN